jgi:predicted transcriptional regulator
MMSGGGNVMKMPKQWALEAIQSLPDDCTWEKILYQIRFHAHVAQGIADADAGRLKPHAEVMQEMEQWLTSLGRPGPSSTSNTTPAGSPATP